MQNTVYRASRLPIFYAAFLLACAVQVWHAPAAGPVVAGLFSVWQSKLLGYLMVALLAFDCVQEVRKRPMCFVNQSAAPLAAASLLLAGVFGVLALANAHALDAHLPIHSTRLTVLTSSALYHATGNSFWATTGLLCKTAGALGVVLVLSFGRRPPGR